jgi:hypothetical protein
MALSPLASPRPWGERHDTSKTRTHTRPVASAAGWPCRFSPVFDHPRACLTWMSALLDPHAKPIQPDHLLQAGCSERRFGSRALGWRREVGHQVPGGEVGQRLRIGGGHDSPFRLVWSIRPGHDLYNPPVLRAARAYGSREPSPPAWLLGTRRGQPRAPRLAACLPLAKYTAGV